MPTLQPSSNSRESDDPRESTNQFAQIRPSSARSSSNIYFSNFSDLLGASTGQVFSIVILANSELTAFNRLQVRK